MKTIGLQENENLGVWVLVLPSGHSAKTGFSSSKGIETLKWSKMTQNLSQTTNFTILVTLKARFYVKSAIKLAKKVQECGIGTRGAPEAEMVH